MNFASPCSFIMSGNTVTVLLSVACICLVGGLVYRHTEALKTQQESERKITSIESELQATTANLDISQQTNVVLKTELKKTSSELDLATEKLGDLRSQYEALANDLNEEKARTDVAIQETQTALEEVEARDKKIERLTTDRDSLEERVQSLNSSLNSLQELMNDAQFKLTASESDREFLLRELKRLQTEKTSIEQQFNDLSVLRSQVKKLRSELAISRRIDWIRRGVTGRNSNRKGAELLVNGFKQPSTTKTNYNLNVEINQSGGVKVLESPPSILPQE